MKNVTMKKDSCSITVPETVVTAFEKKGFVKVTTDAAAAQAPATASEKPARAAK